LVRNAVQGQPHKDEAMKSKPFRGTAIAALFLVGCVSSLEEIVRQ